MKENRKKESNNNGNILTEWGALFLARTLSTSNPKRVWPIKALPLPSPSLPTNKSWSEKYSFHVSHNSPAYPRRYVCLVFFIVSHPPVCVPPCRASSNKCEPPSMSVVTKVLAHSSLFQSTSFLAFAWNLTVGIESCYDKKAKVYARMYSHRPSSEQKVLFLGTNTRTTRTSWAFQFGREYRSECMSVLYERW